MMKKTLLSVLAASLAFSVHAATPERGVVKIGVVLPTDGVYGRLGTDIMEGMKFYVREHGDALKDGSRIVFLHEEDTYKAGDVQEKARRLVEEDGVRVLVGAVSTEMSKAVQQVAQEKQVMFVTPVSVGDELTGSLCSENTFRIAYAANQSSQALGSYLARTGHKNIAMITWDYSAFDDTVDGLLEGYGKGASSAIKVFRAKFPGTDFGSAIEQAKRIKPDAVVVAFAGPGGLEFVKQYRAAGMDARLYSTIYTTEPLADADPETQKAAAGMVSTNIYSPMMQSFRSARFVDSFARDNSGTKPRIGHVLGYDSAAVLFTGLNGVVDGRVRGIGFNRSFADTVRSTPIKSPRGTFTFSSSNSPVQDILLTRLTEDGAENVIGMAQFSSVDTARGCEMVTSLSRNTAGIQEMREQEQSFRATAQELRGQIKEQEASGELDEPAATPAAPAAPAAGFSADVLKSMRETMR